MDFKQLAAFVTVAELKSFSKAAERLYLSQPTISAQIRNLEAELKTRLLSRTTKTVRLTPVGEEFYEDARNILAIQKKIYRRCFDERTLTLRIGASTIPVSYLLPEVLFDCWKTRPDFRFELRQGGSRKIIDGVLNGLHDIGFVGVDPVPVGADGDAGPDGRAAPQNYPRRTDRPFGRDRGRIFRRHAKLRLARVQRRIHELFPAEDAARGVREKSGVYQGTPRRFSFADSQRQRAGRFAGRGRNSDAAAERLADRADCRVHDIDVAAAGARRLFRRAGLFRLFRADQPPDSGKQ